MAERGGFEPPIELPRYRFSKPAHSAALPPLQVGIVGCRKNRQAGACRCGRKLACWIAGATPGRVRVQGSLDVCPPGAQADEPSGSHCGWKGLPVQAGEPVVRAANAQTPGVEPGVWRHSGVCRLAADGPVHEHAVPEPQGRSAVSLYPRGAACPSAQLNWSSVLVTRARARSRAAMPDLPGRSRR